MKNSIMIKTRFTDFIKKSHKIITLDIGEVQIKRQIGQGGNGIVYSASFENQTIALKFLLSDSAGKTLETKRKRFVAEYFNVNLLDNKNGIVKYLDFDILKIEDDFGTFNIPVIIMKKYDTSLNKLNTKNENGFLYLFSFLIETIEKLHNNGIIHRDIKPENILIKKSDFVLADFGIASYNPEIFQIRAETGKKVRIGNRLFSAPEQEQVGIKAHETMDIYSMGQVLQWYCFGEPHRGTNRKKITSIYPNLLIYDKIIDKCLRHEPKERFQKICELKEYRISLLEKDIFDYLKDFNQVLRKSFPNNHMRGFANSSEPEEIDFLFQCFRNNQDKFNNKIWIIDGIGRSDFTLSKSDVSTWKFDEMEFFIKEVWIYQTSSMHNDFILVYYEPSSPFFIEDETGFWTAIVDNQHHISYTEYLNGYAKINGEIIKLSEHNIEVIERQNESGYFFLGTVYHSIFHYNNEETIRQFIEDLKEKKYELQIDNLNIFKNKIRRNIHEKVIERM